MMPKLNPEAADAVVQQALQDGELHKRLLDQLDTGIYMVDRDRRILYWNGGAERITGFLSHEVTGQLCHGDMLMHCDEAGTVLCGTRCPLQGVMSDAKPRECSVFLRHRQGHRVPVHVRSSPIYDTEGAIIGAVLGSFGCLDELTTAANHRYGEMRVRQAIEGLSEFRIPFGWLRIGLDQTEEFERRRLMQETGVQPDQVGEIRGYADQRLRKPHDPNGASNRRVSIVVKYRGG